jgi:hypothetical protein
VAGAVGVQALPVTTASPRSLIAELFYTLRQLPRVAQKTEAPPKQRPPHPRSSNSESKRVGRYCCQPAPPCSTPLILYAMLRSSASSLRYRMRLSMDSTLHREGRRMRCRAIQSRSGILRARNGSRVQSATCLIGVLRGRRSIKSIHSESEILT